MRRLFIYVMAAALCLSCSKESEPGTEQLVVEGWIDEGGYPMVSVTTTVPRPDTPQDLTSLYSSIVRGAQVTVSDGIRSVGLAGRPSSGNFPPYVYTTLRMKGVAGRKYTLTVQYKDRTATAVTTIPLPEELDSIEAVEDGGRFRIEASFTAKEGKHYGFFSRSGSGAWSPVFLSFIDGDAEPGPRTVSVSRGTDMVSNMEYDSGFAPGEEAGVRFCTMEKNIWDWWHTFHDVTGVSRIMEYPVVMNLPSNVEGALGYWAGYGARTYELTMPELN